MKVAICGRTQATLDSTVAELEELSEAAIGVVADVLNIADAELMHDHVIKALGPVNILVNNVGGSIIRDDIAGTSLEDFKATFDLKRLRELCPDEAGRTTHERAKNGDGLSTLPLSGGGNTVSTSHTWPPNQP